MRINEFPTSIEDTMVQIDALKKRVEHEEDKQKRRELFLLMIELRDHVIHLGEEQKNKSA